VSATQIHKLQPLWEWRFEIAFGSHVTVKLISGKAEKDGTELAIQHPYNLSGIKSKILTFNGCELEVEGICEDEFVAEHGQPSSTPMNSYMNLHFQLLGMRANAQRQRKEGPRVLITGSPNTGKTSVARTLAAYATRMGGQPLVLNADPKDGMLSLPGTLSAAVFTTIMDIEAVDGWGSTPSSGPSSVPVKLPLAFQYGHSSPEDDPELYREIISTLAATATSRLSNDPDVRATGMIIDSPGVNAQSKVGLDILAHIVEELSGIALI
jgi:polyribonucleotide 5'-hydroxyl-kinase